MEPKDDSLASMLIYADWLYNEGRDADVRCPWKHPIPGEK